MEKYQFSHLLRLASRFVKKKMNKQIRATLKSKLTVFPAIDYVFISLYILSLSLLDKFLIRPKQNKNTKLEKGKEGKFPLK